MDFYWQALWQGNLVPAAAVGGTLLLGRLLFGNRPAACNLTGSLACSLGFLAGYLALGWAPLQPVEGWHRLVYLSFLGVPIAAAILLPSASASKVFLLAGAAMVSAWFLTPTWEHFVPERAAWLVVVWAAIFVAGTFWLAAAQSGPGELAGTEIATPSPAPDAFCLGWSVPIFLGSAGILMLSGNAKLAQLMGVAAAVAGTGAVCSCCCACCCPGPGIAAGMIPGLTIVLTGLLWQGKFNSFSTVPIACYALPPLGFLVLLPALHLRCCGRRGSHLAAAAGILTIVAGCVLWAWRVSEGGEEW